MTRAIMKILVPTSEGNAVNNTPSKHKGNKGSNTKSKSPSQLTVEASLKSQKVALSCEKTQKGLWRHKM